MNVELTFHVIAFLNDTHRSSLCNFISTETTRYRHNAFQCDLSDLFALIRGFNFPILPLTEQLSGQ